MQRPEFGWVSGVIHTLLTCRSDFFPTYRVETHPEKFKHTLFANKWATNKWARLAINSLISPMPPAHKDWPGSPSAFAWPDVKPDPSFPWGLPQTRVRRRAVGSPVHRANGSWHPDAPPFQRFLRRCGEFLPLAVADDAHGMRQSLTSFGCCAGRPSNLARK